MFISWRCERSSNRTQINQEHVVIENRCCASRALENDEGFLSACDVQKHRELDDAGGERDGFFYVPISLSVVLRSGSSPRELSSTVLQIQAKGWAGCNAGDHHRHRSYSLLIRITLIFGAGHLRIGRLRIYLPHFLSSTHLSVVRSTVRPSKSTRNKPQIQILAMHRVAPRRRHHQKFTTNEDQRCDENWRNYSAPSVDWSNASERSFFI